MNSIKTVIVKHRYKLGVLGGLSAGAWLLGKYLKHQITELMQDLSLEQKAATNLKTRYAKNQQDCEFLLISLLPLLSDQILDSIKIEEMIQQISPENKLETWEQIKIESFVRTITLIYGMSILTLTSRIQLNLLGRYSYLDSVNLFSDANSTEKTIPQETETNFLSLSSYFINNGWKKLMIKDAVLDCLETVSLKEKIDYDWLNNLILRIRQKVSIDLFLLVDLRKESNELNLEFRDFVSSQDFKMVLVDCLDAAFSVFSMQMEPLFFDSKESVSESKTLALVSILPTVSKLSHQVANGVPNLYLKAIQESKALDAFSAIIYTSF